MKETIYTTEESGRMAIAPEIMDPQGTIEDLRRQLKESAEDAEEIIGDLQSELLKTCVERDRYKSAAAKNEGALRAAEANARKRRNIVRRCSAYGISIGIGLSFYLAVASLPIAAIASMAMTHFIARIGEWEAPPLVGAKTPGLTSPGPFYSSTRSTRAQQPRAQSFSTSALAFSGEAKLPHRPASTYTR